MERINIKDIYEATRYTFDCPKCETYIDHLQEKPKMGEIMKCLVCGEKILFIEEI